MKNKQLAYLFFCNLVIFIVGMGLLPLLPLYATQFGATPTVVGVYLAFTYVSISTGTILTGWLVERLTRKVTFLGAGALGIPALVLLGQATALWQVVILTAIIWFCGGIGTASVSVLTGLYADDKRRGKSFGLMFLSLPLAGVVGGASVGQLVAWRGYPLMFAVLAVVWAGWPLVGLLIFEDKPDSKPAPSAGARNGAAPRPGEPSRPGLGFYLILLMALLSATTVYISRLGISLSMQGLDFSPSAVASTATVGGLVTIPITLLVGALSDRLGRRGFLMLGYLLAAAGALALSGATGLWHFWLATGLLFVARSVNGSVAAALATDLLSPETLSRGLPWLNSMNWIAGILGFASAGYLMDAMGATALYLIAATMSVMAAALLGLLPSKGQARLAIRLGWGSHSWMPFRKQTEECGVA